MSRRRPRSGLEAPHRAPGAGSADPSRSSRSRPTRAAIVGRGPPARAALARWVIGIGLQAVATCSGRRSGAGRTPTSRTSSACRRTSLGSGGRPRGLPLVRALRRRAHAPRVAVGRRGGRARRSRPTSTARGGLEGVAGRPDLRVGHVGNNEAVAARHRRARLADQRRRRRLDVSRDVRALPAAARGAGASTSSRGATCARCTACCSGARSSPCSSTGATGPTASRSGCSGVDDAAGGPGGARREDRRADRAGRDPARRRRRRSTSTYAPIDHGRVERAGRAPAGDPGDRRRARGDDRRGAGAVVQLQADVAVDRGRGGRARGARGAMLAGDGRRSTAAADDGRADRPTPRPTRDAEAAPATSTRRRRDGADDAARRDRGDAAGQRAPGALLVARLVARLPAARSARSSPSPTSSGGSAYRLAPGARGAGAPQPRRGSRAGSRRTGSAAARRGPPRRTRARSSGSSASRSATHARYYLEILRAPDPRRRVSSSGGSSSRRRTTSRRRSPAAPAIFVAAAPRADRAARRCTSPTRSGRPVVAPMETRRRPGAPGAGSSGRAARSASGSSACARRGASCRRRSSDGEHVGLLGDRDITGGGIESPLFGAPAPLPIGPALLAIETGAPLTSSASGATGRPTYHGRARGGAGRRRGHAPRARRRRPRRRGARVRAAHRRRAGAVVARLPPDLAGPRGRAPIAPRAGGDRRARGRRRRRPEACMTERLGRADLHIHTLASDGTAGDRRDPRPRRAQRPSSTSSRSPTTSGSTPRSPPGRWPATAACGSRSSSARRSRPSAATCSRC